MLMKKTIPTLLAGAAAAAAIPAIVGTASPAQAFPGFCAAAADTVRSATATGRGLRP